MKVLFVDDRLREIQSLWERSGCASNHDLLPLEPFRSIERTCELVSAQKPEIIFVGFGLSAHPITGADVIRALRKQGYNGSIIGNSGAGSDQFENEGIQLEHHTNRNPNQLKEILP